MNLKSTILEEFDEQFGFLKAVHSTSGKEPIDRIHDFLSSALDRLGQECLEAVPEIVSQFQLNDYQVGKNSARLSLLKSLQSNGVEVK